MSATRRPRLGDKKPKHPPMTYQEKVRIWREEKKHAEKVLKALGG